MATGKHRWTKQEEAVFEKLTTPREIQDFLDGVEYSADPIYRCPRSVLRDRKAHCTDGALFAAAALSRLGEPALIIELTAVRDDDHLLAIYRKHGHYGAVAKSNFMSLRFREPVYRSLRELAMSYFPFYYNLDWEMSVRGYSTLLELDKPGDLPWRFEDGAVDAVIDRLVAVRHFRLLTSAMEAGLSRVDKRTYDACMAGANMAGVYVPGGTNG
ncbi:MAG: hypothetical protein FJ109_10105 [Deltaproteobacteria bacterium]|nr:hypothetical protein [Deltaproteobacteria bacterium]